MDVGIEDSERRLWRLASGTERHRVGHVALAWPRLSNMIMIELRLSQVSHMDRTEIPRKLDQNCADKGEAASFFCPFAPVGSFSGPG